MFPSPTGVNHYELISIVVSTMKYTTRFRPQQGLIIMNLTYNVTRENFDNYIRFRPQQGLIIMNGTTNFFDRLENYKVSVPNRG